jgi:hypothetical protein
MPDFLKVTLPLLGAVVAWLVNQWQQRSREDYLRKEKLYRDLLDAVQGFYENPSGPVPASTGLLPISGQASRLQNFLDQVRLAWLYSPDDVIRCAYAFLDLIHEDRHPKSTKPELELALGNIITAVRRDLFRPRFFFLERTKLTGAEYRHLKAR